MKWNFDWDPVGDYTGLSPTSNIFQQSDTSRWGEALGKATQYLTGTGRDKYTQQGYSPSFGSPQGGMIAPDIMVIPRTPGYTAQGSSSSSSRSKKSGGSGSAIGGAIGAVAGSFIPGIGTAIGGGIGSAIGGLFG